MHMNTSVFVAHKNVCACKSLSGLPASIFCLGHAVAYNAKPVAEMTQYGPLLFGDTVHQTYLRDCDVPSHLPPFQLQYHLWRQPQCDPKHFLIFVGGGGGGGNEATTKS